MNGRLLTKNKIVSKCNQYIPFINTLSKGKKMTILPIMPSLTIYLISIKMMIS